MTRIRLADKDTQTKITETERETYKENTHTGIHTQVKEGRQRAKE